MNLSIKNLNLKIDSVQILKNLSADIPSEKLTCLIGPNGSGKSSILKVIAKEISTFSGNITEIDWKDMTYLPQDPISPPFLNVSEITNLGFYGKNLNKPERHEILSRLLDTCGISSISNQPFIEISSGERQRTWLAFALAQDKKVILMDEPLSAVDIYGQKDFFQLLKEITNIGKTILMVTHDVAMAVEYADNIISLVDGTIAYEGPSKDFKNSSDPYGLQI